MIDSNIFKEMQDGIDKTANLAKLQLQFQEDLVNKIYLQLAPLTDWFECCVTAVSDKLGK